MKKLTLTKYTQCNTTVLEHEFIDHYMAKANGEYVKVYLLLLRHMDESSGLPDISDIADKLDCTEKDVLRAINYWKKQGLIDYLDESLDAPAKPAITGTAPSAAAPSVTAAKVEDAKSITDIPDSVPNIQEYRSRKEREEFKELLFVAEQYLGKTLSSGDVNTLSYFFDTLHMPADLLEYLLEYCVDNGHKSMHYIQKVALSWHEQNILSVADAKANIILYNKNCYSVLNAFGIKGRAPATAEIKYIKKWNEEYGFSLELILEACNRTMNTIHQPNFEYTDSILKNWMKKKVHNMKDVEVLDANYVQAKEQKKKQTAKVPVTVRNNKFNNFDGRSYDMNDLERKLLQQ